MTTFLFANLVASGIKILMAAGPLHRRERFILGCAMSLGVGVSMVPQFPLNDLWPPYDDPTSVGSVFRESILMILSTGFVLAAVTAVILNQIIPEEQNEEADGLAEMSYEPGSDVSLELPSMFAKKMSSGLASSDDVSQAKSNDAHKEGVVITVEAPPSVQMTV